MNCRPGCAACCVIISISSPIPGMPGGKPAGVKCVHLSEDNLCTIHDAEDYPPVCKNFSPSEEHCGKNTEEAMKNLARLEEETRPG
jgi:Fe-S-cluster containining protein